MIIEYVNYFFHKLDLIRGDINKNDRSGALHKFWGYIFTNHIRGDYVEFGVYKGDTLIESYRQYLAFRKWLQNQMHSNEKWRIDVARNFIDFNANFHGLDTFEGMPDNKEGNPTFVEGSFLSDYDEVLRICKSKGLVSPQLTLYKGVFIETGKILSKNMGERKIAIANIDSDLYESAKDALEIIEPHLQIGAIIMFDDYNAFNADMKKGERLAFNNFIRSSRWKFEPWCSYMYTGQAFLCVDG